MISRVTKWETERGFTGFSYFDNSRRVPVVSGEVRSDLIFQFGRGNISLKLNGGLVKL